MDVYHVGDTAWEMVYIVVVFDSVVDFPETKFLKCAINFSGVKLIYVIFWTETMMYHLGDIA